MTVHTLRQCRPDREETEYFWKLFHAAQRNDARWHGSEIGFIAEELSRTDLDRNQKLFLLRAWQVLVDDKGGFGRFMGAFDTYVFNMQDPDDDCVAWKPELSKLLQDGDLLDVVLEAYTEAQRHIAEQAALTAEPAKAPELKPASLINKFYERYPLNGFKNDSERSEALGYFMAGAELQCFGEFVKYEDLCGDE